jgi:hypothetical protein
MGKSTTVGAAYRDLGGSVLKDVVSHDWFAPAHFISHRLLVMVVSPSSETHRKKCAVNLAKTQGCGLGGENLLSEISYTRSCN